MRRVRCPPRRRRSRRRGIGNIIDRPGAARHRLVVAAAPIAEDDTLAVVLTLQVYDEDPGGLLSVHVGDVGFASALSPEATVRRRLGEVVHICSEAELTAVDAAMRAAFDL